jgi:predicted lipoprotein with Yx(FWY)xxD motif
MKGTATIVAALLLVALALAGCGSDDSSDGGAASGSATVSVESIDGVGDVLVDSRGAALYTADQEADGEVRCTASCAEIWLPLTLPRGAEPTGDVTGELGTARRPGGERQVTFDGRPLYRFADDPMAGDVTGDGLSDTFDGEPFSWQVAKAEAGSADDAQRSTPALGY